MLLFRLKVTSRKLMIFLFASMVIRSPLRLKIRQISFFMFSVSLDCVDVDVLQLFFQGCCLCMSVDFLA